MLFLLDRKWYVWVNNYRESDVTIQTIYKL